MKKQKESPRGGRWPRALAGQIAAMLIVGALCAWALGLHAALYGAMLWLVAPLAGGFTAFRAVKGGLNNYAAWIAPAPCLYIAHYAIWRYAPPAGPALLCAFISLVGAAAGEVAMARKKPKR